MGVVYGNAGYQTWSPTLFGFSSNPTGGVTRQSLNGKKCTVDVDYSSNGTSNATSKTFTLPFTAANTVQYTIRIIDNNVAALGLLITTAGSNIVSLAPTIAGNLTGWTAGGNCRFFVTGFTFEIQ